MDKIITEMDESQLALLGQILEIEGTAFAAERALLRGRSSAVTKALYSIFEILQSAIADSEEASQIRQSATTLVKGELLSKGPDLLKDLPQELIELLHSARLESYAMKVFDYHHSVETLTKLIDAGIVTFADALKQADSLHAKSGIGRVPLQLLEVLLEHEMFLIARFKRTNGVTSTLYDTMLKE